MRRSLNFTIPLGLLCMFLLLGTAFAQSDDPDQDSYDRKSEAKEIKLDPATTPWGAFIAAITSIVVSELGDKTFFIAAIMSMRYNRIAVFGGAIAALVIMTGISTAFGWIVPILIPPRITQIIVTVLFFFFGAKLLYDVYTDDGKDDHDEAAEAEEEIDKAHSQLMSKKKGSEDPDSVELKTADDNSEVQMMVNKDDPENPTVAPSKKAAKVGIAVAFVFWQALTLTFLGEWGDRSQITTIALASQSSAAAVFFGASLGHAMCTGLAVIGGKYLAKSISERLVNISGGLLFLVFGIHNLFSI